jgi:SagB-type dehydrogenase family enzyme
LRANGGNGKRSSGQRTLCVRLNSHVSLETRANGQIEACFGGHSVGLGSYSAAAAARAQALQTGLPMAAIEAGSRDIDKESALLVRRLANRGLVEYPLKRSPKGTDLVVIEPQSPDYWPRTAQFGDADVLVLSRFAYMRRRGNDMVLESPRSLALFRICDPKLAAAIATLATSQKVDRLLGQGGSPGIELLGLLLDCEIIFKIEPPGDRDLRGAEGGESLVLWDFHDLLFHTRSTEGRHANPLGGVYPYTGLIAPPPAVRSTWPGQKIGLLELAGGHSEPMSPAIKLIHARHSTRTFDDERPISLVELARFLDCSARIRGKWRENLELGPDPGPAIDYAIRPYPSGGGSWPLELYLAVDKCEGLARGHYHYDAEEHALVPIEVRAPALDALLRGAAIKMGVTPAPQVLITIAARFGRVAWKYSSIAYALILKDVGVLIQTLYLVAADMGLGGCAIGSTNIDLFAKMIGVDFLVEGPVGQFALGRGAAGPDPSG